MLRINRIDQACDYKIEGSRYEGFKVTTSDHEVILVLIESGQYCCEEISTKLTLPDGLTMEEVQAGSIVLQDVRLGKDPVPVPTPDFYSGYGDYNALSVELLTDKGVISLVLSNYHNGYYRHNTYLSWVNFKDTSQVL